MIQYKKGNVTVFQSALYQMTTTIIVTEKYVVMVDPGILPQEIEAIQAFLSNQAIEKELMIIYTHHDFDHIIGAGAFPEAQVIVSRAFTQIANREELIKEMNQFDQSYYLERSYEHVYPQATYIIEEDGQTLSFNDLTLTFYLAPGHTDDGLFIMIEPLKLLIAGDYLSDIEFPFINSHYQNYVQTLNKANQLLVEYEIETLIPGHGTVATGSLEVLLRLKEAQSYLASLFNHHTMSLFEAELRQQYQFYNGMAHEHAHNKQLVKGILPELTLLETDEHVVIVPYEPQYAQETISMWRESKESAIQQEDKHSFSHHVNFVNNVLSRKYKIELALIDQHVVGLIAYNSNEVNQMYVHIDHQNKRIGKLLLERAKAQSAGRLTLQTFDVNHQARRFYEKHGFRPVKSGLIDNEESLPAHQFEWQAE